MMKIKPKRIVAGLTLQGFQLGFSEEGWTEFVFVRKHGPDLFERISVGQGYQRGGRVGDIVSASVECAITPGRTALKGMAEVECLTEIASDPKTGWTALAGEPDAIDWEA